MDIRFHKAENKETLLVFLPERIDSKNVMDIEKTLFDVVENNDFEKLILEASELNYISSIGIRLLMKLNKKVNHLEIIRVNPEVEDILLKIGLDTIIPIFSDRKVIYSKNLEVIQDMDNYTVYKLEDNKALKVLKNDEERESVIEEKNNIKAAFLDGIPTIVPYDYVRTMNGKYGLVYEFPNATSFETLLKDSQNEDELINSFIELVNSIYETIPTNKVHHFDFTNILNSIVSKNRLSKEESEPILKFINLIKPKNILLHTELDFRNVIRTDEGEDLFIHIKGDTVGNPLLDLYILYYRRYLLPELRPEVFSKRFELPEEDGKRIIDKFFMKYLNINEKELRPLYKVFRILSLLTYLDRLPEDSNIETDKEKLEILELVNDKEAIEIATNFKLKH